MLLLVSRPKVKSLGGQTYLGTGTNSEVPSCCGFTFIPDLSSAIFTAGIYWKTAIHAASLLIMLWICAHSWEDSLCICWSDHTASDGRLKYRWLHFDSLSWHSGMGTSTPFYSTIDDNLVKKSGFWGIYIYIYIIGYSYLGYMLWMSHFWLDDEITSSEISDVPQ